MIIKFDDFSKLQVPVRWNKQSTTWAKEVTPIYPVMSDVYYTLNLIPNRTLITAWRKPVFHFRPPLLIKSLSVSMLTTEQQELWEANSPTHWDEISCNEVNDYDVTE